MSQHSEIIAILGKAGQSQNYKIWIGKKEQKICRWNYRDKKASSKDVDADFSKVSGIEDENSRDDRFIMD